MNKKSQIRLFLGLMIGVILIGILFLSLGTAIQISVFNISLTSENLTFTGDENVTRYLDIPRYSNVTSVYLNVSGFVNNTNYTGVNYNISSTCDKSRDIDYYGNKLYVVCSDGDKILEYYLNGTFTGFNISTNLDGIGNPVGVTVDFDYIYVLNHESPTSDYDIHRYFRTSGVYVGLLVDVYASTGEFFPSGIDIGADGYLYLIGGQTDSIHRFYKNGTYTGFNFSVNSEVTNPHGIEIFNNKFYAFGDEEGFMFEYNSTGDYTGVSYNISKAGNYKDGTYNDGKLYVSDINDMIYVYNHFFTAINPFLEIGTPDGTYEWNYTGEFNSSFSPNGTSNLYSSVNSALNSGDCDCTGCVLGAYNCSIPFQFHSDVAGQLEYSEIDIDYDPIPYVYLTSPNNDTWASAEKTFTCNITDEINITNVTLYVWNSTGIVNNTEINILSGTTNLTNFTITFPRTDTYYWNCLAYNNGTYSNWYEDNYTLNVNIVTPIVNLNNPLNDSWTNSKQNINFSYIPSHSTETIDTCKLYGNWSGGWHRNLTDIIVTEDVVNSFFQNLTNEADGSYDWTIWCNASGGGSIYSQSGNWTLNIDTLTPNLTIINPLGTKYSRTVEVNITANDINLDYCYFNVTRGAGLEVANTKINLTTLTETFVVSGEADYVIHVSCNDSANNINYTTSNFSVEIYGLPSLGGGGGARDEEEEDEILVNVCEPFESPFEMAWEDFMDEVSFENFLELWYSFWAISICDSASSIVPLKNI